MTWIDTHAADESRIAVTLVKVTFGSAYYWTDFDTRVRTPAAHVAPESWWEPFPFRVTGLSNRQGSAYGNVTLTLANEDLFASALTYADLVVGSSIEVYSAWFDPAVKAMVAADEIQLFAGFVDDVAHASDERGMSAVLTLSPTINLNRVVVPRRTVGSNCSAEFKDADCGYAGADTECAHTLTACAAKSNQTRFGGFPFIVPPEVAS